VCGLRLANKQFKTRTKTTSVHLSIFFVFVEYQERPLAREGVASAATVRAHCLREGKKYTHKKWVPT
jgi:hypothetical protein